MIQEGIYWLLISTQVGVIPSVVPGYPDKVSASPFQNPAGIYSGLLSTSNTIEQDFKNLAHDCASVIAKKDDEKLELRANFCNLYPSSDVGKGIAYQTRQVSVLYDKDAKFYKITLKDEAEARETLKAKSSNLDLSLDKNILIINAQKIAQDLSDLDLSKLSISRSFNERGDESGIERPRIGCATVLSNVKTYQKPLYKASEQGAISSLFGKQKFNATRLKLDTGEEIYIPTADQVSEFGNSPSKGGRVILWYTPRLNAITALNSLFTDKSVGSESCTARIDESLRAVILKNNENLIDEALLVKD